MLVYLHPNTVSQSFCESLLRLVGYDAANNQRVVRTGGPVMLRCGSGGLVQARNTAMAQFVDQTSADWVFMVDADMGFEPDVVDRLVEAAYSTDAPVISGLCFGVRETGRDGFGGFTSRPFPTIYDWARNPDGHLGFSIRRDYPPNTATQAAGTGAACLLLHRTVAEKIRSQDGDTWFDRMRMTDGTLLSEDLSLCCRIAEHGFPLFVHTGVKTSHHKEIWVGEDLYRLFEAGDG